MRCVVLVVISSHDSLHCCRRWTSSRTASALCLHLATLLGTYVLHCLHLQPDQVSRRVQGAVRVLAAGTIPGRPPTSAVDADGHCDSPLQVHWFAAKNYMNSCDLVVFAGFVIFRGANGQKDTFKRNPNDPSVARESS